MATKWWKDRLIEIDWRGGLRSFWRCYIWWMKLGLITIPFGILYGLVVLHLGHDSLPALIIILAAALITMSRIMGMPPTE
jgi:uncharacterized membrane protein